MLLSNRATALVKVCTSTSLHVSLVSSSVQLNRHEEALVDTDTSITLNPTSFKAFRTRARIHLHLEKYDKAVADFSQAIEQAQRDGSAGEPDVRALKAELKKAELALKRSKTKDYYKILGESSFYVVHRYELLICDTRRGEGLLGYGDQEGVQEGKFETPSGQGAPPHCSCS